MKVIDFHCDTLLKLYDNKIDNSLYKNNFTVDIERLLKGNYSAQFFAVFIDIKKYKDPLQTFLDINDMFSKEVLLNKDAISLATDYTSFIENHSANKLSAFLTIEEGQVLMGEINNLDVIYNKGVRLLTLTWNYKNDLGYPNFDFKYKDKGLTPFGKDVVERMKELKMIVDVSHLSDGGFFDVCDILKSPFVASHSNARAITNHPRNLTDIMIKTLGNLGGVTGINFCNKFLGQSTVSKIEDMIEHIKHIVNVGGIEVLSIGSDFDGIDNEVEIKDCSYLDMLYLSLKKAGFKEEQIEKIFYKNAIRVIKDTLGVSGNEF